MGKREVSFDKFVEEHAEDFAAFEEFTGWHVPPKATTLGAASRRPHTPLPGWAEEFKRSPFIALLSAAGRENCPAAFNDLLHFFLRRIRVKIPEGVFLESPGARGRPRTTAAVYEMWIAFGKPPLGGTKLATAAFGEAFKKADRVERTKMIDRCRKTIGRHEKRHGQNATE